MATDATGAPTSPDNIPTFNTAVDAPSGLGFNAAMAAIQTALNSRIVTPGGITTGEIPVWNGTTWARSSVTHPSSIGFPAQEIGYDQITAGVNITATTDATSTTVIPGSSYTFDGSPVVIEFYSAGVVPPAVASQGIIFTLWDGGTQIGRIADVRNSAANFFSTPVLARRRFTPSAGAHTFALKAFVASTTGTPNVAAGDGTTTNDVPAYLRITRV